LDHNILVGITRGHDLEPFLESVDRVLRHRFDILTVAYYPSLAAFTEIRDFFLKHEEYTHLTVLMDDLIVNTPAIDLITSHLDKCQVVSGICNVDTTDHKHELAASFTCPVAACFGYDFVNKNSDIYKNLLSQKQPIPFKFVGLPFPVIERSVVKLIPFHSDPSSWSQDVAFCNDLIKHNIPFWVDLRAEMKHMKISDLDNMNLQVGKKEPYTKFDKKERV